MVGETLEACSTSGLSAKKYCTNLNPKTTYVLISHPPAWPPRHMGAGQISKESKDASSSNNRLIPIERANSADLSRAPAFIDENKVTTRKEHPPQVLRRTKQCN